MLTFQSSGMLALTSNGNGDKVFLTCYSGYGDKSQGKIEDLKRHLLCFDRSNGEIRWQKSFDNSSVEDEDPYKSFITNHGYATNTPVSDGKSVYFFLGKLGLFAFDLDGKQLWKKEIEYKTNETRWGSAASPILFGDNLRRRNKMGIQYRCQTGLCNAELGNHSQW